MARFTPSACRTVVAAALSLVALGAQAYSFECVTGAAGAGADALGCTTIGESWASWSLAGNQLTITNTAASGNSSFISGISFDTASNQAVTLGAPQTGVLFSTGGGAKLPASLGWTVNYDFKPDTKPSTNGINAGESIVFNLTGISLAQIRSGEVAFGLHIQGLPDGRSEKLVAAVPEAETYAMALAGLSVVGALVLRRRRH